MKTSLKLLCTTAAIVACVSLFASTGSAAQKNAKCDLGQSLQAVIDSSNPGDVINVTGSCSDGPFVVNKDLTLVGDAELSASSPGNNDVISVSNGASVGFRDLAVTADGQVVGFHVINGSSVRFLNVFVSGASEPGINIDESSTARIELSELRDNGRGVQVTGTSNAGIIRTVIQENDNGVFVGQFSSVALDESNVSNNEEGGLVISVGNSYGAMNTRGANPSTVQDNGTDVICGAGGVFAVPVKLDSETGTTFIDPDCRADSPIFNP